VEVKEASASVPRPNTAMCRWGQMTKVNLREGIAGLLV
jgi:hypothetical protein